MPTDELIEELNEKWSKIIDHKTELEQEIMKLEKYRESTIKEMYVIKAWCIAEGLTFDLTENKWVKKDDKNEEE